MRVWICYEILGYETAEQVNVDFAFVEKQNGKCYEYSIIKQNDMILEESYYNYKKYSWIVISTAPQRCGFFCTIKFVLLIS